MRFLVLILGFAISGFSMAQEAKPKPAAKKVSAKAHAKATPEQIRRFNQLEKQQKK